MADTRISALPVGIEVVGGTEIPAVQLISSTPTTVRKTATALQRFTRSTVYEERTGNVTFTEADRFKHVRSTGATNRTFTLPLGSTLTEGWHITFHRFYTSTGTVNIIAQGGDTISAPGALLRGEEFTYIWTGSAWEAALSNVCAATLWGFPMEATTPGDGQIWSYNATADEWRHVNNNHFHAIQAVTTNTSYSDQAALETINGSLLEASGTISLSFGHASTSIFSTMIRNIGAGVITLQGINGVTIEGQDLELQPGEMVYVYLTSGSSDYTVSAVNKRRQILQYHRPAMSNNETITVPLSLRFPVSGRILRLIARAETVAGTGGEVQFRDDGANIGTALQLTGSNNVVTQDVTHNIVAESVLDAVISTDFAGGSGLTGVAVEAEYSPVT